MGEIGNLILVFTIWWSDISFPFILITYLFVRFYITKLVYFVVIKNRHNSEQTKNVLF